MVFRNEFYNWDSCRVCKRLVRLEVKDYLMIKKMTPGVAAWNEPLGGMPIPADSPTRVPLGEVEPCFTSHRRL